MGDLGDGTVYEELAEVLDELGDCLIELQEKMAELDAARGIDGNDSD